VPYFGTFLAYAVAIKAVIIICAKAPQLWPCKNVDEIDP